MPESIAAWMPAFVPIAGIFISVLLEGLARPACPSFRRPLASWLVHAGLLLGVWGFALAVFGRPVFSMLAVLVGQFVVVQVNNAKCRALREPFIFSDFGIFSQALKHPRLYFPFLGVGRAILAGLAAIGAATFGLWIESPLDFSLFWACGALFAGLALLSLGLFIAKKPLLDPEADLSRCGLFSSITQYWFREKTVRPPRETRLLVPQTARNSEWPDIVVIQSESFFDARRLFRGLRPELLTNFDAACASACLRGGLKVPAWGANTMRPEFSFLTGLAPEELDVHRFNPYRSAARRPLRALPSILRELGYNTTCIHPHPARFFRRDRAFPNLGFGRFVDGDEFSGAKKAGPYVSDEAVMDRLIRELDCLNGPAFFFVITMENHGPLHLERLKPGERSRFFQDELPEGCEDFGVYARHLENADRELGRLRRHLAGRSRPTWLCYYGEHVPSMPKVYDALGLPDGRTDYFLEIPGSTPSGRLDLPVWDLPQELLRRLGA